MVKIDKQFTAYLWFIKGLCVLLAFQQYRMKLRKRESRILMSLCKTADFCLLCFFFHLQCPALQDKSILGTAANNKAHFGIKCCQTVKPIILPIVKLDIS